MRDDTLALFVDGYAWLPARFRRTGGEPVKTRLAGRRVTALRGEDAVRFFYDERHIRRSGAVPEPVRSTLFGNGAVHTLDGTAHRVRKQLFVGLLSGPDAVQRLTELAETAWDNAVRTWAGRRIVLFHEAAKVLTEAVCQWTGISLADRDAMAADLVRMVDGFATAGPRHWRARLARRRREHQLADLVDEVRWGLAGAEPGSALAEVARHRDMDGGPLPSRVAAVELLNVIRPTVAVTWFITYAAHAMHLWPEHRERLGEPDFAEAFVHEVRRFYPFAPFVGGRATDDLWWRRERIPAGSVVLLDIFGQNHDEALWTEPYRFDPERFLGRPPTATNLIPQGGGDPATGHRCPGEAITVGLLRSLLPRLAQLSYSVPAQDLRISLRRIPARPRSGFVLSEPVLRKEFEHRAEAAHTGGK